jgi:RND family efflux transporter MFP subunit
MPDEEHGIVKPGEYVTKGEILARIAPAGGTSGWTELINDYRLAKSEFDRVTRLHTQGAVSEKRLQEATLDLENKRARMRAVLGDVDIDEDEHLGDGNHFHLRAGRSGVLSDVHLRYGQRIATGEHLWSIIDPSVIWLEAQVPASEAAHITEIHDAYFTLSSQDSVFRVSDMNGKLISASTLLDPVTRRLPVIFEMDNQDGLLKPGSFAQVHLKTRASHEALAIPETSVLIEDGTAIVYVRATEEMFEKRIVQTGIKDEGFIEIRSGLNDGEYVVSKEAYKVRLASLKVGAASDHHGHSH